MAVAAPWPEEFFVRGAGYHMPYTICSERACIPSHDDRHDPSNRHADMLWRIRATDETWLYLLVLLEFQSTIDRRMALRMLDYTVRVLQGIDEEDLGPVREYPPVLPLVIYNGERRWSAATDVRELFAPVPEELFEYLPRHRYLLIELQAVDLSLLPRENVLSMIAGLEQARSPEQFEEFFPLGSRCFITMANSLQWTAITGELLLTEPPTAEQYTRAGLPWFDYYDENRKALAGAQRLAGLKSVKSVGKKLGEAPVQDEEAIDEPLVVALGPSGRVVREGAGA